MKLNKVTTALALLFFAGYSAAQEIDKSLYQRTTFTETSEHNPFTGWNHFPGRFNVDVVFLGKKLWSDAPWLADDPGFLTNATYTFFDLNDRFAEGSWIVGSTDLFEADKGQLVTFFFTRSVGGAGTLDHIEFPAVDFSFNATHRTTTGVEVTMNPIHDRSRTQVIFNLDMGAEVQTIEERINPYYSWDNWASIVTADSFAGWVQLMYLEDITSVEPVADYAQEVVSQEVLSVEEIALPQVILAPVLSEQEQHNNGNKILFIVLGAVGFLLVVAALVILLKKRRK